MFNKQINIISALKCLFLWTVIVICPETSLAALNETAQPVRVVFPGYFSPYHYKNSDGAAVGIDWEILEEIRRIGNIQISYIFVDNLNAALEMLDNNQADLLASAAIDPKRYNDKYLTIDTATTQSVYVYTIRSTFAPELKTLAEPGRKVGLVTDTIPDNLFAELKVTPKLARYNSMDQSINSLLAREADAIVVPELAMEYRIGQLKIQNQIAVSEEPVLTIGRVFILRDNSTDLSELISHAMNRLTQNGKLRMIVDKWEDRSEEYLARNNSNTISIIIAVVLCSFLAILAVMYRVIRTKTKMLRKSDEYLETILKTADCTFLILAEDFTIKFVNDYTLQNFGFRNEELIGRSAIEMLVPETDSEGSKPREQLNSLFINQKNKLAIVNENVTKSGQRIWTTWSNFRLINPKTGETEIFSIGIDITHQKEIERELKKLQQEKEVILNNMAGGVLFLNADMEVVSVNKEMEHITGKLADELVGRKCYELICKNETTCSNCPAVSAMETGQRYNHEAYTTINGHSFDVISSPLYNNIGRLSGTISIFTDVTQRKQLQDNLKTAHKAMEYYTRILEDRVRAGELKLEEKEENLKVAQNQLLQAEKMASLGKLIAGIGHEINTPLGAIRSSGEIIENAITNFKDTVDEMANWLNSNSRDYFFKMLEQASQTNIMEITTKELRVRREFISNYLKAVGINDFALVQKLIDIGIYQDIDQYREIIADSNIANKIQIIQDISHIQHSARIIGWAVDKAHNIVFALKNFIHTNTNNEMTMTNIKDNINMILVIYGNQLKHGVEVELELDNLPDILCNPDELNQVWSNLISNALHAMEYHGKLTISGEIDDNFVKITVQDTGCGIPLEIRDMIFDPLFTTKAAGQGSGIGLDIVKTILTKHKGRITVESKVGEGSSFIVYLPISNKDISEDGYD